MAIKIYELAGADPQRRFSPYCWRIRMALAHKGLDAESIPWRFMDKAKIAFANSSTVPVIVDGERGVADSWVIANYLEDTYPKAPSLFGGEGGRAVSRFLSLWTDITIHPALAKFVAMDIYKHLDEGDKAYFRASREARFKSTLEEFCADRDQHLSAFQRALEPARRLLGERQFLGGAQPLYADYILFGAFQWIRVISPYKVLEASDPVAQWRERMLGLFDGLARNTPGYPV